VKTRRIAFFAVAAAVAAAAPVGAEVRAATLHSAALGRDVNCVVHLPPSYGEGAKTYPVVYALHGLFESSQFWSRRGLAPILDDMLKLGRAAGSPRPWLGMYAAEERNKIVVGGLAKGGPADRAGVRRGDTVIEVAGERVTSLADMLRRVWHLGPAGTEIPMTLTRDGGLKHVHIQSADRGAFLKRPSLQ